MRLTDITLSKNKERNWWEFGYSYFINYGFNYLASPDKPEGEYNVQSASSHPSGLNKTGYLWYYRGNGLKYSPTLLIK